MREVIFVGDEPSKKNSDPNIPFIGTVSFNVLQKWLLELGLSYAIDVLLYNSHNEISIHIIQHYYDNKHKVVALGNKASQRLTKFNIKHFKLPHPSGRNRQLNDEEFIIRQLIKAKEYLEMK